MSRNWRGEKAEFSVIPNAQTDTELLKAYGFTKPAYCWYAELTPAQASDLKKKIKVCQEETHGGRDRTLIILAARDKLKSSMHLLQPNDVDCGE